MTALPYPNPALRQAPYEAAEILSDADSVRSGIVELGDSSMVSYSPPGSVVAHSRVMHAPLPTGRSEGSEADSNSRQYASFGASNQPSIHNKPGV